MALRGDPSVQGREYAPGRAITSHDGNLGVAVIVAHIDRQIFLIEGFIETALYQILRLDQFVHLQPDQNVLAELQVRVFLHD